jgi:hypothetical protein
MNALTLEGITRFNGEWLDVYSVTCPICGGEELELIINKYECQRCGEVFSTKYEDD